MQFKHSLLPYVAIIVTDGQAPRSDDDIVELFNAAKTACVVFIGVGAGPFTYLIALTKRCPGTALLILSDYIRDTGLDRVLFLTELADALVQWRRRQATTKATKRHAVQ